MVKAMNEILNQVVIESSGANIYLTPRRKGNGLLIAQGGSHILFNDEELGILAAYIAEHLAQSIPA